MNTEASQRSLMHDPARPVEWLETDGTGGFVALGISGLQTRKWHGWWIARKPPRDRQRLLARWEECFSDGVDRVALTARWAWPQWIPEEAACRYSPLAAKEWHWTLPAGVLRRRVVLQPGSEPVLWLEYRWEGVEERTLLVRFWAPAEASGGFTVSGAQAMIPEALACEVTLGAEADCEDRFTERQHSEGEYRVTLRPGTVARLALVQEGGGAAPNWGAVEQELARRQELEARAAGFAVEAQTGRQLALGADQFIVRGAGFTTILAGYPWFTDWGRDTMIALPGLALAFGRREEAREILRHFLHHLDGGLIPNLFPEVGAKPQYNTVDGTLWLVEMLFRCFPVQEVASDEELLSALRAILGGYREGTHQGIHVADDGLVVSGGKGCQLTWMDVKVNGEVPTPRHGKPVEIQGLWYNAQKLAEEAATAAGDAEWSQVCRLGSAKTQAAFLERFWCPRRGYLADVVDRDGPGTADWARRPNGVIPLALRHGILPDDIAVAVLEDARLHLRTPRGLRTLGGEDPRFRARYRGDLLTRDRSYHQGTAWMWLLWPYAEGLRRFSAKHPGFAEELELLRHGVQEHLLEEGCFGQASEIFDAVAPHHSRGCFAQAWSLAATVEILRRR